MKTLKNWSFIERSETGLTLLVDGRHHFRVDVLEEALFRISLKRDGVWRLDRSWSIAPGGKAPWEGRRRDDLSGFTCPGFVFEERGTSLVLTTPQLRLTIRRPLALEWEASDGAGGYRPLAADRATSAYMAGVRDSRNAHFLAYRPEDLVYGLGEKAGDLKRNGRRFEMRNLDAMGYDAKSTDPLYKVLPFTVTRTPEAGSYGLFYDNLAGSWFDIGNEYDNYHGRFRAYRALDGDLDFYFSWAPTVLDVVKTQNWLTGGTAFPPRWTLGYSGSTMSYTDAGNAQEQLQGFVDLCAEHAIPCDSFQMSSGYTAIGHKRYVFNWNHDRVPEPKRLSKHFRDAGMHLAANIKPCLLQDHPLYEDVAARGLFIRDSESDAPERSSFWDDEGSHLDFTNPATIDWWKENVTTKLLDQGIECTWNDNNEYEIWDDEARCHGFGEPIPVGLIRPLFSLLMTRASFEAQLEDRPHERPYLICRAGAPGLQRYAQTWSGDNYTSWETLRYNISMGLGMSLSGFYNIGHDVGGFAGPRPEPELFVRWVQNGIFHPRFTIHSWNDDGTVNEPWMYPEVTPLIRAAIRFRYRLLPYLYTLLRAAVALREPIIRPTFLDHEHDARCFEETSDFMLGRDLLVAGVVEPGACERCIYLPDNGAGWWDFWTGNWHAGGQEITIPVTLESMPLFVRAGCVLPLGDAVDRADAASDTARTLAVFPSRGEGEGESCEYEDDGIGIDAAQNAFRISTYRLKCTGAQIALSISSEGAFEPHYDRLRITLPAGETRPLAVNGRPFAPGDYLEKD
ncbi:glycoside hydrolase family 31 protein [Nitratireductor sp.]|uniref:glycoside hydrolase family 31 protein n=1 Tax=Nitratireductor sp. TaxID=1872084 RepID=UPI0026298F87|nr:glycoside hydrolase family 31 protein [Nitratireductor sp.]MCV0378473.1 glycoside hydrolase family 31 protein [Nitratireductor sp.]